MPENPYYAWRPKWTFSRRKPIGEERCAGQLNNDRYGCITSNKSGMMAESTVFTRVRSAFWMRVNENDDGSFNFFVSQDLSAVVKHHFPEVEQASPTGWKSGSHNTENVWIPADCADQINVDEIKQWAEFAGNQCVWLKLGKHLQDHFSGSEVDFCVAADFNRTTDGSGNIGPRSVLGEAESQLKYHLGALTPEKKQEYCASMSQSLLDAFDLLPLRGGGTPLGTVVSPIPAQDGSSRLAWAFAKHVADRKGVGFIEPRLLVQKPQMKQLTIQQKVTAWTTIYQTANSVALDPASVQGRDVVIVDDLYQSGITMWAYAKALRTARVRRVFGLVCVKSMRDSDNQ